jgi:hypothetical protein
MKSQLVFFFGQFRKFLRAIAAYIIAALFVIQIADGLPAIQATLSKSLGTSNRSFADKMRTEWGTFFDLMQLVQDQTPVNAVLLFDSHYAFSSVNLYFLFPRTLIYGDEETLHTHPEIGYVVISENYPQFSVPGEKIMVDERHGLYKVQK